MIHRENFEEYDVVDEERWSEEEKSGDSIKRYPSDIGRRDNENNEREIEQISSLYILSI